jgi:TIR domain
MNAKLFINYRRDDTAPYAGRLYDRLIAHFSEDQVFIDIDQIEPGEDFVEVINRKVGTCDIAIVAIGPNWLHATDASGKRRLDDEEDFVRMEIVAALQRKIRVIPVLVGGARMPGRHDLPEALAPLSRRNAIELSEARFHADVNRLIEAIEKSFAVEETQGSVATAKEPTTPVKSTQTTPATPPVPSTSSIAALKEPKVWTRKHLIIVAAVGATVILLLAIAQFAVFKQPEKKPTPPVLTSHRNDASPASPSPSSPAQKPQAQEISLARSSFLLPDDGTEMKNAKVGPFCCTGTVVIVRSADGNPVGYIYFYSWKGQAYNVEGGSIVPDISVDVSGPATLENSATDQRTSHIAFQAAQLNPQSDWTRAGLLQYRATVVDFKLERGPSSKPYFKMGSLKVRVDVRPATSD